MVALFVVLFIIIILSLDGIVNRERNREFNRMSEKERLVAQSSPPELGITMADGGELIDNEKNSK